MADEIIRIQWIAEFRDEAKGLPGAMRRATQEFNKAQAEQRKSNTLMVKSSKEAAEGFKQQIKDQEAGLRRFRTLALQEHNIRRSIAAAVKNEAEEKEKAATRAERADKRAVKSAEDRGRIEGRLARERETRQRQIADAEKKIADLAAKREADQRRRQAEIDRQRARRDAEQTRHNRKIIQDQINEDLRASRAARRAANERIAAAQEELRELRGVAKERDRLAAEAIADARREESAVRSSVEATKRMEHDRTKAVIDEIRARRVAREKEIDELTALRARFPGMETMVRGGGLGDDATNRRIRQSLAALNTEGLRADRTLSVLQGRIQQVAVQARNSGEISRRSWEQMERAAEKAGITTAEFADETRKAGLAVRNFHDDKRREISVLRDNNRALTDSNLGMRAFTFAFRGLRGAVRLSTNEMILFNRTMQLLVIPAVIAMLGVLAQALHTAGAAAFALGAALAPLVGQIAALPAVAAAATQAMLVWNVATTKLGKSSLDLGKIIEVSLTGSVKDFGKMLEDLNEKPARDFAKTLRTMAPALAKLRSEFQTNIFGAMTAAIKDAAPALRPLRDELVSTSQVFGDFIRKIGQRVGTRPWARDLEEQAKRTNFWMRRLQPAVLNIAEGMKDLTLAAGPLVNHMIRLTNAFGRWFRDWSAVNRRTGRFSEFFEESNQVLDRTISILQSLGSAFINIGKIAYNVIGRQLLRDLDAAAQRFEDWTESPTGIRKITEYFEDLKPAIYEAGRLLKDLVVGFFRLSSGRDFFQLLRQFRTDTLPAILNMFEQLSHDFAPALLRLVRDISTLIAAWAGEAGTLTRLVDMLAMMARFAAAIMRSPGGDFIAQLVVWATIFRTIRYAAAITGLTTIGRLIAGIGLQAKTSATQVGFFNRIVSGASGGRIPRAVPAPHVVGRWPGMQPQGGMTRGQRWAMAGGEIGTTAGLIGITAGSAIGGTAGGVITGAGAGALAGSMFGPAGVGIGAALGGLAGGLIAARQAANQMSAAVQRAATSAGRAANALDRIRGAREELPRARLDYQQSILDTRSAIRQRQDTVAALKEKGLTDEEIRKTDEFKQAQLNVAQAYQRRADALKHLKDVQEEYNDAVRDEEELQKQSRQRIRNQITDLREWADGLGTGHRATKLTQNAAKGLAEELRKQADQLKANQRPAAIMAARLAEIAEETGRIPTKKEVEIAVNLGRSLSNLSEVQRLIKDIASGTISVRVAIQSQVEAGSQPFFGGGRRGGGFVPGDPSRDGTQIMASGGEFVVTGGGERMLESMTFPGVLDWLGGVQPPHFAAGGRIPHFQEGGRFTPRQIGIASSNAGFRGQGLLNAIAVAWAESRGRSIRGRADPRDRGPWQINSYFHPEVSDFEAFHLAPAARETYRISQSGKSWAPWTTFKRGMHRQFIPLARNAVKGLSAKQTAQGPRLVPLRVPGTQWANFNEAFAQGVRAGEDPLGADVGGILPDLIRRGTFDPPVVKKGKGASSDDWVNPGVIPKNAPDKVKRVLRKMLTVANRMHSAHYGYVLGAGHTNPAPTHGPNYDCSSAVSALLQQSGINWPTSTSGGFLNSFGVPGRGDYFTIWAKPGEGSKGHVVIEMLKRYWGTSSRGKWKGPQWLSSYTRPGMTAKRLPGFRRGGRVGLQGGGRVPFAIDPGGGAGRGSVPPRAVPPPRSSVGIPSGILGGINQAGVGPKANVAFNDAMVRLAAWLDRTAFEGLNSVNARLRDMLGTLRTQWAAAVRAGRTKDAAALERRIKRIDSALSQVAFEMGERVGAMFANVEKMASASERASRQFERDMRRAGIDPSSAAGTAMQEAEMRRQQQSITDRVALLNQWLNAPGLSAETRQRIRDELDKLAEEYDELDVQIIEMHRETAEEAAQAIIAEMDAKMQAAVDNAQAGFDILQATQMVRRTNDTAQGMMEQADYINNVMIPAMKAQLVFLLDQLKAAGGSLPFAIPAEIGLGGFGGFGGGGGGGGGGFGGWESGYGGNQPQGGYSEEQVLAAAAAYGGPRGYTPKNITHEGQIFYHGDQPGINIKYYDEHGGTTTEWTPLQRGGRIGARQMGVPAILGEGGHDEFVLSTDPKLRSRTDKLLMEFMKVTGRAHRIGGHVIDWEGARLGEEWRNPIAPGIPGDAPVVVVEETKDTTDTTKKGGGGGGGDIAALIARIGALISGIMNAIAQAMGLARAAVLKVQQDLVDAAAASTRLDQIGLQRLELEQRISKTFGTQSAAQARRAFIETEIIPSLQAEITAMEGLLAAAVTQGEKDVERQTREAIEQKRNEILQAQLEAMEQTEQNTAEMANAMRTSLGFEFRGQTFTDLLGAGVGA